MNNKYYIKVKHPLVRPGLSIETECSEKYVRSVTLKLLDLVREINGSGCCKPFVETSIKNPISINGEKCFGERD